MRWDFSTRKLFLQSESVLKLGGNDGDVTTVIIIRCIRALLKFIAFIFPRPLILSNLGEFSKSWILKTAPNCTRENELCHRLFSFSFKKTHAQNVVLVTQRNVSKSVMHVHSCYFAYTTYCIFNVPFIYGTCDKQS